MEDARSCPAITDGTKQEAGQLPLVIIRRSLRILIGQKYFPLSSLQTVVRLWLPFLLLEVTSASAEGFGSFFGVTCGGGGEGKREGGRA